MVATDLLTAVEHELSLRKKPLGFQPSLEMMFAETAAERRRAILLRISLLGLGIYNSFLITDFFMIPDVFVAALIIQLGIVTPFGLILLALSLRKKVPPEPGMISVLIPMFAGIVVLCHMSASADAPFLVFTYLCVLLFGNAVLPLSFRRSLLFTSTCLVIGGASILTHGGLNPTVRIFTMLLFASSAVYVVLTTYRMEDGERLSFLYTLREKLAAQGLAEHNGVLRRLSETDALTGIGNRRSFDIALDRLCTVHADSGAEIGLIVLDIDHFKRLNDSLGHLAGDQCLQAMARCLDRCVGEETGLLARYGGEEFAVILPHTDGGRAAATAERLRAAVAAEAIYLDLPTRADPLFVTVSVGFIVTTTQEIEGPANLIAAADEALYQAKRMGRNRVRQWTPMQDRLYLAGA